MLTFNCNEAREEFAAYDRGESTPAERAAIESHLAICSACRDARALDARIDELLQNEQVHLAPAQFETMVRDAVRREAAPARRARLRIMTGSFVLAAAALLLAVGVWKFVIPSRDDDNDLIEHLDVVETLALLRDEMPADESALAIELSRMNNSTLQTLIRTEDEDGF